MHELVAVVLARERVTLAEEHDPPGGRDRGPEEVVVDRRGPREVVERRPELGLAAVRAPEVAGPIGPEVGHARARPWIRQSLRLAPGDEISGRERFLPVVGR